MKSNQYLFLFFLMVSIFSCSQHKPKMNIAQSELSKLYTAPPEIIEDDNVSIILTFSGGGTRAASFSYGVLKALNKMTFKDKKSQQQASLLSKIDLISAVSGGSITAAYFGLHGADMFDTYESVFLREPIQSRLERQVFRPSVLFKLSSGYYARSDMAADYYAKNLFDHKTIGDFRNDGPHIVINATDISAGEPFSFTPEMFQLICSDLDSYPISRAVAASSSVPGLFTPIGLYNQKGCEIYDFQKKALEIGQKGYLNNAKQIQKYIQKDKYPYLHLVDGGIGDNLGVRSLVSTISKHDGSFWKFMKQRNITKLHQVIFIVVNAATDSTSITAKSEKIPNLVNTLWTASAIRFVRYNKDTLNKLNTNFKKWEDEIKTERCKEGTYERCDDIKFYLAELDFLQLDPKNANYLSNIATSFELEDAEIDALIQAGEKLLLESPEFNQFYSDYLSGLGLQ